MSGSRSLLAVLAVLLTGCAPRAPQADSPPLRHPDAQVRSHGGEEAASAVVGVLRSEGTIAFEDSVHALVVFVRFPDDDAPAHEWPLGDALPPWGLGLIREDPTEVDELSVWDPSLSSYFAHQSANGTAPMHVLTGEIWPRAAGQPHAYIPRQPSAHYRSEGYGFLVAEVLGHLAQADGMDPARFDANQDGELDHLMLVVRRDPGVRLTGGVANLSGVNSGTVRTYGRPAPILGFGNLLVDMGPSGSGTINWVGGEYAFRTLVHEYGHVLFDMGHTRMITPPGAPGALAVTNDVPFGVPDRGGGAYACAYSRMCGGGADGRGRPVDSSNYDATITLSGAELRRMGWADRTILDPSRAHTGVTLAPLFGSGQVALIPLAPGSGADTLSLEVRRRDNAFDAFPPWDLEDPFYGLVYRDLPAEGLLATLTVGDPTGPAARYGYDWAPPANALGPKGSRCDGTSPGCVPPYRSRNGDMWGPASATQMTPWTRPNVSGYTVYPEGTAPNWFALMNIRDQPDGAMSFDLIPDLRRAPGIRLTADSWMGTETSGTVFDSPVTVASPATLCVWQGATVDFRAGLGIEPGAAFRCADGATCRVQGRAVASTPGLTCAPDAQ